jgi:hypothetical protein
VAYDYSRVSRDVSPVDMPPPRRDPPFSFLPGDCHDHRFILSSTAQRAALTVVERHGRVVALVARSLFTCGGEYATTDVATASVKGSCHPQGLVPMVASSGAKDER